MAVADWARIQATAHQITTEASILDVNGATIATPRLPISSLRWGQDARNTPTLSAQLTVPTHDTLTNVSWAPRNSDSALTPFGNQIKVDLKISNDKESDTITLGVGVIETVTVDRPQDEITVSLTDRADALVATQLDTDLPPEGGGGHSSRAWFPDLVARAQAPGPGLAVDATSLGWLSGVYLENAAGVWAAGSSIMSALTEIAGRYGCWVGVDRGGSLRIRQGALVDDMPATSAAHKYVLSDGPGGTLLSLSTTVTRAGVVNRVFVKNTWPDGNTTTHKPTYGWASTSTGPTRFGGPMGNRTKYVGIDGKRTTSQVRAYARNQLAAAAGLRRQITLTALLNPYLDPADAIKVVRGTTSEQFTVASVEWSLPAGTMSITGQGWVTTGTDLALNAAGRAADVADVYGLEEIVSK